MDFGLYYDDPNVVDPKKCRALVGCIIEDDKEGEDVMVQSNGRVGTGVTDNQNAGMFQGFSDSYFYSGYGNLEGAYGPADR